MACAKEKSSPEYKNRFCLNNVTGFAGRHLCCKIFLRKENCLSMRGFRVKKLECIKPDICQFKDKWDNFCSSSLN